MSWRRFRRVDGGKLFGVLSLVCFVAITTAEASLTYSNPFHPEQCELAVSSAERDLARREDARAREILAEGLLCRGLEADDPWALAVALDAFRARAAARPDDFFAKLYVAVALQRLFPLAPETMVAVDEADDALVAADIGAARPGLESHVAEMRTALEGHRRQFLPILQQREGDLNRGSLTRAGLIDVLILLAETGPAGIGRAHVVLDSYLESHPDVVLDTFYRAEISRGRDLPHGLMELYRTAEVTLCRTLTAEPANECERARWRLEQLETIVRRNEGGTVR